jgi:predicted CxxxxCH...CXXCH cytochrome family protein
MRRSALLAAAVHFLAGASPSGCTSSPPSSALEPITYVDQIKSLLEKRCVRCHSGDSAAGSYDLSNWRGLIGVGSSPRQRNVVPGDPGSRLLLVLDGTLDATHGEWIDQAEREMVVRWVVEHRLAYFVSTVHPADWLYPGDRGSAEFHGGAMRKELWRLDTCRECHGTDLAGGAQGGSCADCHKGGVETCDTCHGEAGSPLPVPDLSWGLEPRIDRGVGAHEVHAALKMMSSLACSDCHVVPQGMGDTGHLFDLVEASTKTSDLRAEVRFSTRVQAGLIAASYDQTAGTCTVSCHSDGKGEAKPVSWTGTAISDCAGCHAMPGAFGTGDCALCHRQDGVACQPGEKDCWATTGTIGFRFVDQTTHGDGIIRLGSQGSENTCWGCHGTSESAGAPAPDLSGATAITALGVGLHAVHLSPSEIRPALACGDCHIVPSELTSSGHLDSDLPAEVTFGALARGDLRDPKLLLAPAWVRQTATCSNTYCHHLDSGTVSTWTWTEKVQGGLACDSCHGYPPQKTFSGKTHVTSTACDYCHHSAFLPGGKLNPATHLNGKIDFYADP